MIAVRDRLMPAVRSVGVALLVASALMTRRTAHRIYSADFDLVLLDAISPHVLQMTVLQVVDVAIVFDGLVTAGGTVDMGNWFFLDVRLVHGISPVVVLMVNPFCYGE